MQNNTTDIPANTVECLFRHFGNDPVLLIKSFECEDFALQTHGGKFWASSIDSLRKNNKHGQGDPNESVAPYLGWCVGEDDKQPPTNMQWNYLVTKSEVDKINKLVADCSIICFYGVYLENCLVGQADDVDYLYFRDDKFVQDFGSHVCTYDFKKFNAAIEKLKISFPLTDFGRVYYRLYKVGIPIHPFDMIYRPYFWKDEEFEYQNEYRVFFPYKFPITDKRHILLDVKAEKAGEVKFEKGKAIWFQIGPLPNLIPDYKSPFSSE
jgi:hypothetical protein